MTRALSSLPRGGPTTEETQPTGRAALMPGLAAKVGIVSVSRIIGSLAVVAAGALLSRLLSPADYGTFQQVWLAATVATTVLLAGLPLSVFYFVPRETPEGRHAFLRLLIAILTALGAAAAIASLLFADLVASAFHNPPLAAALRTASPYLAIILFATPLESFLIAQNRHRSLASISIVAAAGLLAAVAIPPILGAPSQSIYASLAGYALLRSGLLLAGSIRAAGAPPARLREGLPRELLLYSIPLGANEAVRVASGWLDKALVASRFDPETFAIYANGAFEIPLVSVLLASVTSVLMPEFSRLAQARDPEPVLALWRRSMRRTALVLLPLSAAGFLLARDIVVLLFSERYAPSAAPFRVYLFLLPLRCAAYTPILLALGRGRAVLAGAIADLALSLSLALLLIPRLGYLAPAVALVISTYLQAGFYLAMTGRALSVPMLSLIPWGPIARVGLAALLAALPLVPLGSLAAPPALRLAAALLAYAALLVTLLRTPLAAEEERRFVAEMIGSALRLGRGRDRAGSPRRTRDS